MSLPDVSIQRQDGLLKRSKPVADRVIGIILTGAAVATKIALAECKQIFGTDELPALGITNADNPFAYAEILSFYAQAGEGAELNFMLVSDATSLTDICDVANNIAKKLLDFAEGRINVLLVNRKLPVVYNLNRVEGLDSDVWAAITKMNALGLQYDNENKPFDGILPGIGYTKATLGALKDINTLNNGYVTAPVIAGADNTGRAAMGTLAGWIVKNQLQHNIARVASGAVLQTGYFIDGTTVSEYNSGTLGAIHDKRYIFFRKIAQKSGYFFNDDPGACNKSSDFSSLSWKQVINKAKRIAYGVLVEHLNDDVDTDEETGKISTSVAADWEGDVERAINLAMVKTKQATSVKCTVDTDSDITNDQVSATLFIVRKGQAKTISVKIGFTETV